MTKYLLAAGAGAFGVWVFLRYYSGAGLPIGASTPAAASMTSSGAATTVPPSVFGPSLLGGILRPTVATQLPIAAPSPAAQLSGQVASTIGADLARAVVAPSQGSAAPAGSGTLPVGRSGVPLFGLPVIKSGLRSFAI